MTLTEGSLHKWFKGSKSKDGKGGWVNVVTGGTCASDKPGEGTPKCVSSSKRASMTKAERLSAARRKKKADPGQQQKSGAAKPTYVRTDAKKKMKEEKELKTIAKELDGAVVKHKSQADRIRKHIKGMKEEVKLSSKKNCGCGQNPCVTYGKKELTQAQEVEEACWKGYEKKGMKTMFGKRYPNCVKKTKKEEVEIQIDERLGGKGYKPYTSMSGKKVSGDWEDSDRGAGNKAKKRAGGKVEKKSPTFQAYLVNKEEVELDEAERSISDRLDRKNKLMKKTTRKAMDFARKEGEASGHARFNMSRLGRERDNLVAKLNKEEVELTETDKKGKGSGTKDACYHKVKSRYSVWPSAYASGALVKCRKVGAANWGNSTKKESYSWRDSFEWEQLDEGAAWTKKEGKNKSGGLNEKGRKSYERDNPGSDLKAPSKKVGNPRRKSFCARMKGMKRKLTSAKTANDPDSRINKSLRAWNC